MHRMKQRIPAAGRWTPAADRRHTAEKDDWKKRMVFISQFSSA